MAFEKLLKYQSIQLYAFIIPSSSLKGQSFESYRLLQQREIDLQDLFSSNHDALGTALTGVLFFSAEDS